MRFVVGKHVASLVVNDAARRWCLVLLCDVLLSGGQCNIHDRGQENDRPAIARTATAIRMAKYRMAATDGNLGDIKIALQSSLNASSKAISLSCRFIEHQHNTMLFSRHFPAADLKTEFNHVTASFATPKNRTMRPNMKFMTSADMKMGNAIEPCIKLRQKILGRHVILLPSGPAIVIGPVRRWLAPPSAINILEPLRDRIMAPESHAGAGKPGFAVHHLPRLIKVSGYCSP